MNAIFVVASNTFRQTVRERLFFNILVFAVGMILMAMTISNLTFGYPERVVRSIGLSGISIALDLMALLLGVSLVHQEIDKKTLFVVLTRPLRRWQYVIGRYLGMVLALAMTAAGLTVILCATLLSVPPAKPSLNDLFALGAQLVEACVIGGIGLVLSTYSTPTLSAGIGIGLWLCGATTDDFVRLAVKSQAAVKPLAWALYYLLPALARFNFREAAVYGSPVSLGDFAATALYGVGYASFLVLLASIVLGRREML
jgi:ABC-type transport system involved in multi-copper enzyme maturation permease subunit